MKWGILYLRLIDGVLFALKFTSSFLPVIFIVTTVLLLYRFSLVYYYFRGTEGVSNPRKENWKIQKNRMYIFILHFDSASNCYCFNLEISSWFGISIGRTVVRCCGGRLVGRDVASVLHAQLDRESEWNLGRKRACGCRHDGIPFRVRLLQSAEIWFR